IDGDERRFAFGQHFEEAGNAKTLGGEEGELQVAIKIPAGDFARGGTIHSRMNAADAQTARGELGTLIFHEGDEWADDKRCASAYDCGALVAERFAGAGGHDEQQVSSGNGGLAGFLLVGPEAGVSENLRKDLEGDCGVNGHGALARVYLLRIPVSLVNESRLDRWRRLGHFAT